jgi:hypothetical protein
MDSAADAMDEASDAAESEVEDAMDGMLNK